MRKIVLALVLSIFTTSLVSAQTISLDTVSSYIGNPGLKMAGRSGQMNVFVQNKNGVYANLWGTSEKSNSFDETDWGFGFARQLSSKLSFDGSLTYWHLTKLFGAEYNTVALSLDASYAVSDTFSIIGRVRPMFVKDTSNNGVQVYTGVSKMFNLNGCFAVNSRVYAGHDNSFGNNVWFAHVDITPQCQITDSLNLRFLGLTAIKMQGRETVTAVQFGLDYSF